MPFLMLLGLLFISFTAVAQHDAGKPDFPSKKAPVRTEGSAGGAQDSSSAGASGDAARARAGANASVEGGAALGATGIDPRPAAKTEQAEKEERRRSRRKQR